MSRAVVFAYHNVGVRCLSVLLAHDIDVTLVVTHNDNPAETIWFESVARLAQMRRLPLVTPDDPNTPDLLQTLRAMQPDFLFSFYYRHMLQPSLLAVPRLGALNVHGSLLPRYRGRVPVNWAVINGETETGATLHYMTQKPDAGDIVDQLAVPIAGDDTAFDVFGKVTEAAVRVLDGSLPALIAGHAPRHPQDLTQGSYYGGRKPEDGRIDWKKSAASVHNLVRGVAPPYPGAFTRVDGEILRVLRTRVEPGQPPAGPPGLCVRGDACIAVCADGGMLRIMEMQYQGKTFTARDFLARFGDRRVPLETLQQ